MAPDQSQWDDVTEMMDGGPDVNLGKYIGYWFENTPRRALFSTSYYKFAAKMIGHGKRVLDAGCNEGLGTWILASECGSAKGIDQDGDAIQTARSNWNDPRVEFHEGDFLQLPPEQWDAVVSLDVIEHILQENVDQFWRRIVDNLSHDGIAIIGAPSLEGQIYASEVSKAGHVNLYTAERLEKEMRTYFTHVFLFGANDEIVHTGFPPMSHYLLVVGCKKRV